MLQPQRRREKREEEEMRDLASCFSENAIKVSDTSCSGSSTHGKKSSIVAIDHIDRSIQIVVTSLYRIFLSTRKDDVLIKVTWSRTHVGPMLSLGIDDDDPSHFLWKKKGTQSYVSGNSVIGLYWDYTDAKFGSGPEPVSNFYAVVTVDAQLGLLLGDLSSRDEYLNKLFETISVAESSLVSRREQVLGNTVYYSTRARFSEGGKDHDIVIRCDKDSSELVVSVDKKKVVQVGRLHWNFRGNQTIFIDGAPVDMMWDVVDWWFMFRKRSALESRLWLEEEMLCMEKGGISGFSLLIQAFKNP